jgi:hypothetical protein
MSIALDLSVLTAATAFMSIALASSGVPWELPCWANITGENATTAVDAAEIINVRNIGFFSSVSPALQVACA